LLYFSDTLFALLFVPSFTNIIATLIGDLFCGMERSLKMQKNPEKKTLWICMQHEAK